MSNKKIIIKGTLILTITGLLTRVIGFFYRIFLSHTFGEEGVGLYQLIFPIYALCFSFTAAGIQTMISRCVAQKIAQQKEVEAKKILLTGVSISLFLSFIMIFVIQSLAPFIALHIIQDQRCEPLLYAMTYAFPFASLHSCISGYYFGTKKTVVPSVSQLIEQIIRVCTVSAFCYIAVQKDIVLDIKISVIGLVAGEIASAMYILKMFTKTQKKVQKNTFRILEYSKYAKDIVLLSAPLTANRVLLNVLQSIEAVSIPTTLQAYGYSISKALSTYGVLTGMALPCILFPSAITNSISIMLLPTVAEIQATDSKQKMSLLIKKVSSYCFLLGVACFLLFIIFGRFIGSVMFQSELAGDFILTLAWICPFLYLNTTLISIINGLGKTTNSFVINTIGLLLRIAGVFFLIPRFGIKGYLWGLLLSQVIVSILCFITLSHTQQQNGG
ncbi:oligosaccharide flippase family protein [Lachnospiraceae bacterium LCP25S3_G4]